MTVYVGQNVIQLPSSVVSDSRGSAGQDLLVFDGSTFARLPVGAAGQTMVVRSDGTVGYADNTISLAGWKAQYPNLGNGSNDDTAAIQAWASAVIAAEAKGVAPPPSTSYNVSSTINLTPSGANPVCIFELQFAPKTWLFYNGPSGTDGARQAVFNCVGWKQQTKIKGLQVRIPSASYVTVFEIDNPCTTMGATYTSGQAAGTSLQLGSTTNLVVGQHLVLSAGTANAETLTIASIVDATHATFTAITANAHTSGDAVQSTATSFSGAEFDGLQLSFPTTNPGLVGFRLAHTNTATIGSSQMDVSNITWREVAVIGVGGTGVDNSTSQVAYQSEGNNTLALRWFGGGVSTIDKCYSNKPTTNSGTTATTKGDVAFYGLTNSVQAICDYEFVGAGSYLISGGRYERGLGLFLRAQGSDLVSTSATDPINVTVSGLPIISYLGGSSHTQLFALQDSVALNVQGCRIGANGVSGGQWTSALITMTSTASGSRGALTVWGSHVSASDPFYTVSSGDWTISLKGNVQTQAGSTPFVNPDQAIGRFQEAPRLHGQVVRSGAYVGAEVSNLAGTVQMANGIPWAMPLVLDSPITVTAMGVNVGTVGDAGSTVALCIWSDNQNTATGSGLGVPQAILLNAGSVAGDGSTGYKEVTGLSFRLNPGTYWVGGIVQNVSVTAPKLWGTTGITYPMPLASNGSSATSTNPAGYSGTSQGNVTPGNFAGVGLSGGCPRAVVKAA